MKHAILLKPFFLIKKQDIQKNIFWGR